MNLSVGALILAAGDSSRLGRPKQLLQYRGRAFLLRTVTCAREAGCSPIVVVTKADAAGVEAMRQAVGEEPVQWVANPLWERGMGTSLRAGIQHLLTFGAAIDAVLILVCDQPLITADHLRDLVETMVSQGKTLVAAGYEGTVGVPVVMMREHFSALAEVGDTAGAKSVLKKFVENVAIFPLPEAGVDVDDEASYQRLLQRPISED